MSEKEKALAERLAAAFDALPESKKEYLLGYADGVAGMQAKQDKESGSTQTKEQ